MKSILPILAILTFFVAITYAKSVITNYAYYLFNP